MVTTNVGTSKKWTRRDFLAWLWGVSLIGLFADTGAALFQFFKPRVETGALGSVVIAGTPEEFKPNTVSHIQKGRFYISRLDDGGVLALWQRCTHLGCTVPWVEDAGEFHCPCHSSVFDRKGVVLDGPAPRPLSIFPVSLKDGKLVVDTSRPIDRDAFDPTQVFRFG